MSERIVCHHGMAKAKGCTHAAVGHFSRLFPSLDNLVLTEDEAAAIGGPGGLMHDFDDDSPDSGVPAGYIFFAQLIDHDITFDTTSDLRGDPLEPEQVAKLPNLRTASLDLDAVYGFGPEGSPHIYDNDNPDCLAVSPNGFDLARSPSGTALIGDPRNDENIFVAQLHLVFHKLHNRFYNERVRQRDITERGWSRFEAAQRETRYHYQWVVLFDFLKRICDPAIFAFAAARLLDKSVPFPLCYGLDNHHKLSMPVEFSTAAYRVGHAMVRNRYAVNGDLKDVELFDDRFRTDGFTSLPEELIIDWRHLLEMSPHVQPRMAKAFNPLLSDELQDLPVVDSNNPNNRALAFRNLMRANALGVPSGQAVATELKDKGYPLDVTDLELDDVKGWKRVQAVLHKGPHDLAAETPLFYYLLRESEVVSGGARYGPLGSAILMEVFGGMLRLCDDSVLHAEHWQPDPCVTDPYSGNGHANGNGHAKGNGHGNGKGNGHAAIDQDRLVNDPDYYPLQLADLVRFAMGTSA